MKRINTIPYDLISRSESNWKIMTSPLQFEDSTQKHNLLVYSYKQDYRFDVNQSTIQNIVNSLKLQDSLQSANIIKNYSHKVNRSYGDITIRQEQFDTTLAEIRPSQLTYLDKLLVVQQIAKALKQCHQKMICHRLVNPFSIAISQSQTKIVTAKLNNFTKCVKINKNSMHREKISGITQDYAAPELIKPEKGYNLKSDVWSLGAIFYELIFGNMAALTESKNNKTNVQFPCNTPKWLIDIIAPCLKYDATKRCCVSELVDKLKAAITCSEAGAKLIKEIGIKK